MVEKYENRTILAQLLLEESLHHFPVHPEAKPALLLTQVDRPSSLVELNAGGIPVEALQRADI